MVGNLTPLHGLLTDLPQAAEETTLLLTSKYQFLSCIDMLF
jgi:hypothetical protein